MITWHAFEQQKGWDFNILNLCQSSSGRIFVDGFSGVPHVAQTEHGRSEKMERCCEGITDHRCLPFPYQSKQVAFGLQADMIKFMLFRLGGSGIKPQKELASTSTNSSWLAFIIHHLVLCRCSCFGIPGFPLIHVEHCAVAFRFTRQIHL